MEDKYLCIIEGLQIGKGTSICLSDIDLKINKGEQIGILSKDGSASALLQVMAGMREMERGKLKYPLWKSSGKVKMATKMQYVPDDIICYTDLTVKQFLQGVQKSYKGQDFWEESLRLCEKFGIELKEQLLNLTIEQNRMVAMVQAMAKKPELLLLDRPYDLLGSQMYALLIEELGEIQKKGTTLVISANVHENISVSCDRYLFLEDGKLAYCYKREELPVPAKVVTIFGGNLNSIDSEKIQVLWESEESCRVLYREKDMQKLAISLSETGCTNFNVQELTMEEEIFGDYERWTQ